MRLCLTNFIELKVDNNDIDELAQEYSQELTTNKFMELHLFLSKKSWRSLSKKDKELTAQLLFSGVIRKMLKTWKTVSLYIENNHPNKAVAMQATNLFNAVPHFHQIFKHWLKQMFQSSFFQ